MNRLSEMTWQEVEKMPARETLFILPLGANEQHGERLPLGTDHFVASHWSTRVAEEIPNSVLMPLLPYGMSWHHTAFPGTVSFSPPTYMAIVQDLVRSVAQHGFYNILIVNGHGGNHKWIEEATNLLKVEYSDLNIANPVIPLLLNDPETVALIEQFNEGTVHAGAMETSLLAAISGPEILRDVTAVTEIPEKTEWGVGTTSPVDWKTAFSTGAKGNQLNTDFNLGRQLSELTIKQLIEAGQKLVATNN